MLPSLSLLFLSLLALVAVYPSRALLYRQRDELATERAAVKALHPARAALITAVREEDGEVPELAERPEVQLGSCYTVPFACFLACFSDAVSAV